MRDLAPADLRHRPRRTVADRAEAGGVFHIGAYRFSLIAVNAHVKSDPSTAMAVAGKPLKCALGMLQPVTNTITKAHSKKVRNRVSLIICPSNAQHPKRVLMRTNIFQKTIALPPRPSGHII